MKMLSITTLVLVLLFAVACGSSANQPAAPKWAATWVGTGSYADITIIISGGPGTYQINASSPSCTTTGSLSVNASQPNSSSEVLVDTVCDGVNEGSGPAEQWVLAENTLTIEYANGNPNEVYARQQ